MQKDILWSSENFNDQNQKLNTMWKSSKNIKEKPRMKTQWEPKKKLLNEILETVINLKLKICRIDHQKIKTQNLSVASY